MRNFLTEADLALLRGEETPSQGAVIERTEPEAHVGIEVETTVQTRPNTSRHDLMKAEDQWGWEELRDYVVTQIEAVTGPFPRNPVKEKAIFSRFVNTWGAEAPAIARYAFEVCGGWWAGAPIQVQRFCKGSDAFFAEPIAERLRDAQAAL